MPTLKNRGVVALYHVAEAIDMIIMKISYFFLFLTLFAFQGLSAQAQQTVKTIQLDELQSLIAKEDGKTRVINFWATWCRPCVAEMPHFDALSSRHKDVEVIFVSLDFADNLMSRVQPFVERKNIQSEVVLLAEDDAAAWMPQINEGWQGNIPATLIVNQKQGIREFHAKELSEAELNNLIQSTLNP